MDHSRQSVLRDHCIGDTHKKQKERAAQIGQIQGSLFTKFLNVENEFLVSEAIDIVDSDTLEDLREFLSSNSSCWSVNSLVNGWNHLFPFLKYSSLFWELPP